MASVQEILSGANHRRIESALELKDFDCDDGDLNEFFHKDASVSQEILLSVTYVIETEKETIAFYSLSNDKISKSDGPSNNQWNRFRENKFQDWKAKLSSYPCVKLGRLGVNKKYQSAGIGEFLINHIKLLFITNNRTGCRFITVDAYNKDRTLKFYERNGFLFLPVKDSEEKEENPRTKLMYYDLIQITNAQNGSFNNEESKFTNSTNLM
ncbi:MAG: GNAT family N-acetyltransferase [Bacteroidota bacterium]|nr:GNAT family N-acetyltransferase [Bacteroidota bacterium]MDP3145789.1 GNAT family N-acetyltransferase [Bacteroidota bacterium]